MDNLEKFISTEPINLRRIELGEMALRKMEAILNERHGLQIFRVSAAIVLLLTIGSVITYIYMIFVGWPPNLDPSLKLGGYILISSWGLLCVLLPGGLFLSSRKLGRKAWDLSMLARDLSQEIKDPSKRDYY